MQPGLRPGGGLSWDVQVCRVSEYIEACDPDLVLALDLFTGKLTRHPTVAWLQLPPANLRLDWERLKRVLSNDGFLAAMPELATFLSDRLASIDKQAPGSAKRL